MLQVDQTGCLAHYPRTMRTRGQTRLVRMKHTQQHTRSGYNTLGTTLRQNARHSMSEHARPAYSGSQSGRSGGYASARYCTSPAQPTTMLSTIGFHSSAPATRVRNGCSRDLCRGIRARPAQHRAKAECATAAWAIRCKLHALLLLPPLNTCRGPCRCLCARPPRTEQGRGAQGAAPLLKSASAMPVTASVRDSAGSTMRRNPGSSTYAATPASRRGDDGGRGLGAAAPLADTARGVACVLLLVKALGAWRKGR